MAVSKPSVPAISNYISVIENTITEFRTRNDSLTFNGITILNNNINENGIQRILIIFLKLCYAMTTCFIKISC